MKRYMGDAQLDALMQQTLVRQPIGKAQKIHRARVGSGQRGLVRLRGETWRLQYRGEPDAKGRRKQHSVRLGDRREGMTREKALTAAALRIEQVAPRRVPAGSTCTWSAWCDRYAAVYLPNARPTSRHTLRSILRRHVEPAFRAHHVHEITTARIQTWIADMRRAKASPETIRGRYRLLRRLLGRARAEGLAVTVPQAGDIDLPRSEAPRVVVQGGTGRGYGEAELSLILRAADERAAWLGILCRICAFVGIRISEALALSWSDIDFPGKRLVVMRQAIAKKDAATKSASSVGQRPIPSRLLEALAKYRATLPAGEPLLFPSPRGGYRDASGVRRRHLKPLLGRLAIFGRSFHAFRHRFATSAVRSGASVSTVQRLMRHSSVRATERYIEADSAELDSAIERVEAGFMSLYPPDPPDVLSGDDERNAPKEDES